MILLAFWEVLKIRAACDELEMTPEDGRCYSLLHGTARRSPNGVACFELDPAIADDVLKMLEPIRNDPLATEDYLFLEKMYTDPAFREEHLRKYHDDVLHVYKRMNPLRIVMAAMKNTNSYRQ